MCSLASLGLSFFISTVGPGGTPSLPDSVKQGVKLQHRAWGLGGVWSGSSFFQLSTFFTFQADVGKRGESCPGWCLVAEVGPTMHRPQFITRDFLTEWSGGGVGER